MRRLTCALGSARPLWLVALVLLGSGACGPRTDASTDAAAAEPPGGAITLWTDSTELFMEHPALIAGQAGRFAVHLTDITDFAPLRTGRIVLRFEPEGGGEGFAVTEAAPSRPGIFGATVQFPRAGTWHVRLEVESPQARDVITVPELLVYATAAEVPADDGGDDGIAFLKEQQWQTRGFRTAFAEEGLVAESFEVPGTILPASGRRADVSAPIAGLVEAEALARAPIPGQRVRAGEVLLTLRPTLGDGGSVFAEARGALRDAESEYARAQRLVAVEAAPVRRLREAESRLQVAREALAGVSGGHSLSADGTLPVRAPIAGVVTEVGVSPGALVAAGGRLFTVVDPTVVWVEVNLPVAQAGLVGRGAGAAFLQEGSTRYHEARRTVSVGAVLDSVSRTLPVRFEAANPAGAITVGANARVAVRTGRRVAGVVIPFSAVLDQDGRAIVYVQRSGERFEKRGVQIGGREGDRVVVLSGLARGDRVVTEAAYQVQLAALSTSAPAHGHEH